MRTKINSIVALVMLLLAALACSFSTANLSEIKFGKDKSAKDAGTKFKPEDEIFAVTAVNNAGDKNKVKFRLLFDDVEGANSGSVAYKLEKELEVDGSRDVYFSFSVPGGIVPGSYKAEAVLLGEDGKELDRKIAAFTVDEWGSSKKTTGRTASDEVEEYTSLNKQSDSAENENSEKD